MIERDVEEGLSPSSHSSNRSGILQLPTVEETDEVDESFSNASLMLSDIADVFNPPVESHRDNNAPRRPPPMYDESETDFPLNEMDRSDLNGGSSHSINAIGMDETGQRVRVNDPKRMSNRGMIRAKGRHDVKEPTTHRTSQGQHVQAGFGQYG